MEAGASRRWRRARRLAAARWPPLWRPPAGARRPLRRHSGEVGLGHGGGGGGRGMEVAVIIGEEAPLTATKLTNPSGLAAYAASQVESSLSWKIVRWLQTITQLPILVKGIITAEDTRIAIECGVAGIIVSNHGGRQLDYVPATINCLEEVVREAKGRVPVFLDSGIRRGTDVFKALALGASGVFIGRPLLFALGVDGEAGVRNALWMLRDELELAMALSGCTSLKDITRNHVSTEGDRVLCSRL